MARVSQEDFAGQSGSSNEKIAEINAEGQTSIEVPSSHFITDSEISREGQDLLLETPQGETLVVNNYFSVEPAPVIESPDGSILTENLVNSFLNSSSQQYAQAASMTDESPVGAVEEMSGEAKVIRADGSTEQIALGTPIYKGDIIETSADGAVNVLFIDETSMAVSENARMSIDEYEFDPSTESGETNLSVLRGVFVFTSGLIGRDDPDDVLIDTPVGSIGIRGTIIAGKIQPGAESEITVVEGAIVVKNGAMETTLSTQYETVKLTGYNDNMQDLGVKAAGDVGKTYGSVSDVVPKLFSSINDSEKENTIDPAGADQQDASEEPAAEDIIEGEEIAPEETLEQEAQENLGEPALENIIDGNELNEPGLKNVVVKNQNQDNDRDTGYYNKANRDAGHDDIYYNPNGPATDGPIFNFSPRTLFEQAKVGDVVATISIQNAPPGVTFNLSGPGTGNFTINNISNGVAQVVLNTTAGTAGTDLGSTTLVANLPNGNTVDWAIPTITQDASVNLNSPGGLNYDSNVGVITTREKIGDFDGDGVTDHAVGLPFDNAGNGQVNIIDGSNNNIMHPIAGASGNFGYSVSAAGDINNDGFADVIAGAPNTPNGAAFIINGTDSVATPSLIAAGMTTGDMFGFSVTGLGDYDGTDGGKSDYAVSAINADAGGTDRGEVYIFTDDGASSITISGHQNNMRLGEHLEGVGDIDGDGISDLLVSAQGAVGVNNEAYIVYGGTGNTNTASLNKVSTPHDIVALGAAGDINGDGHADFAISLDNGTDINTFVVYGGNSLPGTMDMTSFLENPDNALKINHAGVSGSNYQVTAIGDTNGDGFDDIRVGTDGGNQYVVYGNLGGNAVPYVTDNSGSDGDPDTGEIGATTNNQSLVGRGEFFQNTYTGLSMKGGSTNDTFKLDNSNFQRIDGGKGVDIIHLGGTGLNFSAIDFEQIDQIETIQLGDSTINTLTVENIFNMLKSSDNGSLTIELDDVAVGANLNIDATVSSNVADALNEEGTGASLVSSTGGYDHYQIGGYNLYIDQSITTTVV